MDLSGARPQPQRGCVTKPRVGPKGQPWVAAMEGPSTPNGVAARWPEDSRLRSPRAATPLGRVGVFHLFCQIKLWHKNGRTTRPHLKPRLPGASPRSMTWTLRCLRTAWQEHRGNGCRPMMMPCVSLIPCAPRWKDGMQNLSELTRRLRHQGGIRRMCL